MRVIAVANQKGGCGKTTTSINFSACLAFLQKKVLLIDLDPQGHSTCGLGVRAENLRYTLYDLLKSQSGAAPGVSGAMVEINPFLYLLPCHGTLGALEEELSRSENGHNRLKRLLDTAAEEIMDADFVVIDCPPHLGPLTYNALLSADQIFIPVEPSFFSLHGLAKISETLNRMNQLRTSPLEVHALLTLFNSRTSFAEEVFEEVKAHFGEKLFRTIIHENIALKEAASAGQSIVQYDPKSAAFQDYLNLAVEYLEREWDRILPERDLGWKNVMAQRFGPKRVMGGTLFQFVGRNARWVEIAGDFNNWIPESLERSREDEKLWQIVLPIAGGIYRYKYIVDGEWQIDPCHPVKKQNQFGTFDSYLELV